MASHHQQDHSGNPVSDLLFDWISVLHNKAEGVNAYEKYIRDAEERDADKCVALFQRLREQDIEAVREIKEHLAFMMDRDQEDSEQRQGQGEEGTLRKMQQESEAPTH